MKKITLLSLLMASSVALQAQKKEEVKDTTATSEFNKWTIEATVGQAKGVKPYAVGYFSSDPGAFLGKPQANSFSLSGRYMLSPNFGFRGSLHYDNLKNIKDNGSKPFEMQQFGVGLEGVVNLSRLLGIQENLNRFGLLAHGGIKIDAMTSKTANVFENDHNNGVTEWNGGLVIGVTPQFRITQKLAVMLDVSVQNNYRQHFNWDGSYSEITNNLNGQLITGSLGLSYSFGPNDIHGDWAVIRDKKSDEIEALGKRIDDMETLMNDTDKDGVPDYLDQENNSVAGVAVDTRGKMVDINRNGVPDELERYVDKTTKEVKQQSNEDMVTKLINEGYVTTYFDTNKSTPTNVSTEGIDFMLTYLRNFPNTKIEIIGHADEVGSSAFNNNLANKRAEAVKAILVKAGIAADRMTVVTQGEDTSVDPNSDGARKLVRRVTFRVK
ncbi:OmpA family protein [Flavobacterium sp. N1719]|uniref:OmpA family protein n=1 Tax=Flavobacterium sp. N1719 TaxID=2885633 RepID=UPI002222B164|nr:OmpA family protein [Flavobacterium sp. N1719]